jgi:hypothetical protein
MSETSDADFSMLLWALGLLVAGLAWHLSNGWLRIAQRGPTLRSQWRALALAAASLGLGLNAALVLGLEAQPLAFPLGFHALGGLGLVLGGLLMCVPVVVLPAVPTPHWRLLLSGALMAVVALGLQAGWVLAAGFRPGVLWRREVLAAAALVLLVGLMLARWMAFSAATEAGPRRVAWRLAAAVLGGLTLMAGQQLVCVAAGLGAQRGSLYEGQLHGTVLGLVCGVLVPLVMAAMVLDLWLRRQQRPRRGEAGLQHKKRRKRRQRLRTL